MSNYKVNMVLKEQITDIFFDLDHTLWDFEKNSMLTFGKVFEEESLKIDLNSFVKAYQPINKAYWKAYRENKIDQQFLRFQRLKDTFAEIDFEVQSEIIPNIANKYITYLSTFPHLIKGTLSLLKALELQYNLHIITNGFEQVQHHKLKNSGIAQFFDKVITAEQVGFKKPHPQIFKYALEVTGASSHQALMIGDSFEADIEGSLKMGFQAIHFNIHEEPIHSLCPIVTSLGEIQPLLI